MEQRRLRLGDILDDYCPRERRVTNHAVVAMIEDDVKQTRCTTCDSEHVYKGGRAPRRRRKDTAEGLYREVLAGISEAESAAPASPSLHEAAPGNGHATRDVAPVVAAEEAPPTVSTESPSSESDEPPHATDQPSDEPEAERDVDVFVHRRLIRATLPRPEGQKEVRAVPDFTIRANGNRHGSFRGDRGRTGGGNGHGPSRPAGRRFPGGAPGPGGGRTGRPGFGGGGGRQGGGRKRSR